MKQQLVDNECSENESNSSFDHAQFTSRQLKTKEFLDRANLRLFGPLDFIAIAPTNIDGLLLSDESITTASELFGAKFDKLLRSYVQTLLFISLAYQLVCLLIGCLILTEVVPSWAVYFTIPGCVYPTFLLLRSHWHVFIRLLQTWEPVFLMAYATIFSVVVLFLLHDRNVSATFAVFIFFVMYPSLISAAFADASAIKLDYAFVTQEVNGAVLGFPPYLVSLGCVAIVLILIVDNAKSSYTQTVASFVTLPPSQAVSGRGRLWRLCVRTPSVECMGSYPRVMRQAWQNLAGIKDLGVRWQVYSARFSHV